MGVRYFALIVGIFYLLITILGFIPALNTTPPTDAPKLAVTSMYEYLFGLFPVNLIHHLVHLLVGLGGIFAYTTYERSRLYSRIIAILFGVLTIFGLIPGLKTLFGLAPLFGNDIWLHALTAIIAAYFGWLATHPEPGTHTRVVQ